MIRALLLLPFFTLSLSLSLIQCTPKQASLPKSSPYRFDYTKVLELTLARADVDTPSESSNTASGTPPPARWSARFVKAQPQDRASWKIASAPEGKTLSDTWANGRLLEHLLDTLRSFQVSPYSGNADQPLEMFGLRPPRFALRWCWQEPAQKCQELLLGDNAPKNAGVFALLQRGHEQESGTETAPSLAVIRGALLPILMRLSRFQDTRLATLLVESADDFDEITLIRLDRSQLPRKSALHAFSASKLPLYAQREGAQWTDHQHRPVRHSAARWLSALTGATIRTFLDEAPQTAALRKHLETRPTLEFQLVTRDGSPTVIRLFATSAENRMGRALYATTSSRSGAVFELDPSLLEEWN